MYHDHFNFDKDPFSIAPDPDFLYPSQGHREALAHLMYGFEHGGFVLITGEVGTGKTTLLRNLIKLTPPNLDVAFILNPRLTVAELLETICEELGIPFDKSELKSVKQYIDVLNRHLQLTHKDGRSTVVIIDEAQNLSPAVLEQIRLLTNLETNERKLLRIILLGQPELGQLLERTELRQLAQRITARYHLTPLNRDDCYAYVSHRLTTAGGNPDLFTDRALSKLFQLSKGTPRLINIIADRALLGAYVEGTRRVTPAIVTRAAKEVLGQQNGYRWWLPASIVVVASIGMAWAWFSRPVTVLPLASELATSEPVTVQTTASQRRALERRALERRALEGRTLQARALDAPATDGNASEQLAAASDGGASETQPSGAADPDILGAIPLGDVPQVSEVPRESVVAIDLTADPVDDGLPVIRPDRPPFVIHRMAYAAVFQLWGQDFAVDSLEIPCDFAPSIGLQCLKQSGSWSDIDRLNLPVVLELQDGEEIPFFGAITSARGGRYTLHIGDEQHVVVPEQLSDVWFGRFVAMWQTPPGYHGSLREGDEHSTVGWLRAQLANIVAIAPSPVANRFDSSLYDAVTAFQRQEGLVTDGVVGPDTWIRLTDRSTQTTPKLER